MKDFNTFLSTIYLGDRACKSLLIDGWRGIVELTVNLVSRIRDPSGNWNYYSDEDIENGIVVFSGIEAISLDPPGRFPNDTIEDLVVERIGDHGLVEFRLTATQVVENGNAYKVIVRITARDVYLVDPINPQTEIRT